LRRRESRALARKSIKPLNHRDFSLKTQLGALLLTTYFVGAGAGAGAGAGVADAELAFFFVFLVFAFLVAAGLVASPDGAGVAAAGAAGAGVAGAAGVEVCAYAVSANTPTNRAIRSLIIGRCFLILG
jgi:hypothetical protein